MSYPLIIFGAGASFDCRGPINKFNETYKPPLTHELFESRFFDLMRKFSNHISDLTADVSAFVRSKNFTQGIKSIEEHFQDVIEHGKINKDRLNQLVDFRYYLQYLFSVVSQYYSKPDNSYCALKVAVDDNCQNALYVTFNYDNLLDHCFGRFENIDSYISGQNTFIKLHGSCNWFYQVPEDFIKEIKDDGYNSVYDYLVKNPENITSIINNSKLVSFRKLNPDNTLNLFQKYIPALAIPVPETKTFICPKSHITALTKGLESIDRILIVGWRGADKHLIELLKTSIPIIEKDFPILVVSHSTESAKKIVERLFPNNGKARPSTSNGFHNFMAYSNDLDFIKVGS